MSVLEKVDENYVVEWAEKRKFICLKIRFGVRGYPDRLFISPTGHTIFMEFKRAGLKKTFEQKERLQAYRLMELQSRGIPAFIVDSRIEAINILKAALESTSISTSCDTAVAGAIRRGATFGPRPRENVVLLGRDKDPPGKGAGKKDSGDSSS